MNQQVLELLYQDFEAHVLAYRALKLEEEQLRGQALAQKIAIDAIGRYLKKRGIGGTPDV